MTTFVVVLHEEINIVTDSVIWVSNVSAYSANAKWLMERSIKFRYGFVSRPVWELFETDEVAELIEISDETSAMLFRLWSGFEILDESVKNGLTDNTERY